MQNGKPGNQELSGNPSCLQHPRRACKKVGLTLEDSLVTTVISSLPSADAKRALIGEGGGAWPRPAHLQENVSCISAMSNGLSQV